jgi:hypothetical protein
MEFPCQPEADTGTRDASPLLDSSVLLEWLDLDQEQSINLEETAGNKKTAADQEDESLDNEIDDFEQGISTDTLRDEGPGETATAESKDSGADEARKYEDPRAERAHQQAQQRDPSDVVEIGETVTLVLKEVDFRSHSPTVMGTKNKLVIFVTDAPQDLAELDTIRAKVVDYGGGNNSAEAVFIDYVD